MSLMGLYYFIFFKKKPIKQLVANCFLQSMEDILQAKNKSYYECCKCGPYLDFIYAAIARELQEWTYYYFPWDLFID